MAKVGLGIIGAGSIAHATGMELAACDDVRMVAIADPNAARANAFAQRFAVPAVLASADEAIARSDVDAVYIAVPNRFHAECARTALAAGKHALLEKPFSMNYVEARSVADAAAASGRIFMVGMNQRFGAAVQAAKGMVERGDLGSVFHAKAFWRRRSGIPRIGSWFTHRETAGGGGLLDIGVHMLDAALYLMDNFEPASVSGATYTNFGHRGLGNGNWGQSEIIDQRFDVDDFATGLVKFGNGATVAIEAAWALHQRTDNDMSVVLYGTDATLDTYGRELYREGQDGYQVIQNPAAPQPAHPVDSRVRNFVNAILGRETPLVTVKQSLAVQRILDGLYQSAQTGDEIKL